TASISGTSARFTYLQVIGFSDAAVRVAYYRQLACAVFRIGREVIETLDAVQRNTYYGGASSFELVHVNGEGVSLDVATGGVSGGIEVNDGGAFAEGFFQRVGELLTIQ